jgi:2,3-bisphosphoglycerate-dependent phosphoglycerate mutase
LFHFHASLDSFSAVTVLRRDHGDVRVDIQAPFAAPTGAAEVVLVRHGSCTQPPKGEEDWVLGEQNDPPLDERGRAQAIAVCRRLEQEPIGAVFVTPLRRTTETAAPLLEATPHRPQMITDLREVMVGDWENGELLRRALAGDPEYHAVMRGQRWDAIPNAEPADHFANRVWCGLNTAADTVADDTPQPKVAVVFTHSAVIAELLRQIAGSEPFAFLNVSNGSLTRVVRLPDGRWVLVSFNETAHLPLEFQPRAKPQPTR